MCLLRNYNNFLEDLCLVCSLLDHVILDIIISVYMNAYSSMTIGIRASKFEDSTRMHYSILIVLFGLSHAPFNSLKSIIFMALSSRNMTVAVLTHKKLRLI